MTTSDECRSCHYFEPPKIPMVINKTLSLCTRGLHYLFLHWFLSLSSTCSGLYLPSSEKSFIFNIGNYLWLYIFIIRALKM